MGEEEYCAPPEGPVVLGVDELICITLEKRRASRLPERRIQIPGRRMEKFIPPPPRCGSQERSILLRGMQTRGLG
jgi:hypothetical protein